MNTTILRLETLRVLRDPTTLFFIVALPAFFYLIFGASQGYASDSAGNGNVAMIVMISMAAYGAVTATVGIGGQAAVERGQGWGRQLGLTPLRDGPYVSIKATLAVLIAMLPVLLVYTLGVLTGSEASADAWLLSLVALVVGAVVFSLYGLCFGLAFRSEAAVSGASGSIVILSFLGNIFFPLSGALLAFAKWTPTYGYVALARYPVTDGVIYSASDLEQTDPLWVPLVNVIVWALVFAVLATYLVRRGRRRQ